MHFNPVVGTVVANSDTYMIIDGKELPVLGGLTPSVTYLHKKQSTRGHSHDHQEELYVFVRADNADMEVGKDMFRVYDGSVVAVPAGAFHKVKNYAESDCVFLAIFPGKAMRPALRD